MIIPARKGTSNRLVTQFWHPTTPLGSNRPVRPKLSRDTGQTQSHGWGRDRPRTHAGAAAAGDSSTHGRGAARGRVRPVARSKAVMASSQLVRFSSCSHMSPEASRRDGPPHQDVGPAVAHLELEQLRQLELLRSIRANDRGGRVGLDTEVGRTADVGAESVDVKLVEHPPGGGEVQAVGVGRRARKHLERAHPARREQRARRQRGVFGIKEHLVPHCEAHVPPVRVELRFAPVLPLLHKRQHLARHLRQ
jgi:hypothetical protein